MEVLRIKIPSVNAWFQAHLGAVLRREEQFTFSGVPWMIIGVLGTSLLLPGTRMAVATLLYLILGDAAASLAGKRIGGPHWPHSPKRVSGSLACLFVCLGVGVFILGPDYGWACVFWGAAAAAIAEGLPLPINDNLLIPLTSALVLLTASGTRPWFLG